MTALNLNDNLHNLPILSITESWSRTCTTLDDRPLSAAHWQLEEMSGEKYLDELPELQVILDQLITARN
jgi:hypothetical protein